MQDWLTSQKIAHRGLHNNVFPENSLGAFENACKKHFAIELDVQEIQDGTIIVFHDDDLSRVCNRNISVSSLISDELGNFTLFNTQYTIPTLQEVLNVVAGRVPILIELKNSKLCHRNRLAPKVYDIIKDYRGDLAIKSFNPLEVMWFKRHAPHITRGMLACYLDNVNLPKFYKFIIRRLSLFPLTKPHFISYCIGDLPNKFVANKNVPLITWTISSRQIEMKALELADNIIFEGYTPEQSHIGV